MSRTCFSLVNVFIHPMNLIIFMLKNFKYILSKKPFVVRTTTYSVNVLTSVTSVLFCFPFVHFKRLDYTYISFFFPLDK